MNVKFKIVDDYTKTVYNRYRVSKSYNPEDIFVKFGEKYVVYSQYSSGKFLKSFDKEKGKVEFTDKLGYALLFKNLVEARQMIIEVMNSLENKSTYLLKVVGKDLDSTKLKSCCIETEIV